MYHLTEGPDAATEPITLKLSTPGVIIRGISRIEAWSRVERGVGGTDAIYELAPAWEAIAGEMTLSTGRLAILAHLAAPHDVASVCRAATLPHFEVCQMLWAFRIIGLVNRVS
jgi:hypothetical protein